MLLVALGTWWTFAVIVWVMLMHEDGHDAKYHMQAIGLAVFWPLVAVGVVPALIYQSVVASSARIRADIKNRGLLREFNHWLNERDS